MIEFHLSGGASNTDPQISIGGAMSTQQVQSEIITFHAGTIGGVTITGGVGNYLDTAGSDSSASLSYIVSGTVPQIIFNPYGKAAGTFDAEFNNVLPSPATGSYVLTWSDSWGIISVSVAVVAGSLPAVDTVAKLDVTRSAHQLFDPIPQAENMAPVANYRCVYAKNTGAASQDINLFLQSFPLGSGIQIGLDPLGVGGVPASLASETIAPSGVVFSVPASLDEGLVVTLAAGAAVPVWLCRLPNPMRPKAIIGDNFNIVAGVVA